MHVPGSSHLRPFVRSLLKAYENMDPPTNQQRAVTQKLLRAMAALSGLQLEVTSDTKFAIVTDLAIVAYFFAMRSCEFSTTRTPGRTRIIRLSGVLFRSADNSIIDHRSPVLHRAERVTLTFGNQKNGIKMDRRTHQRTPDDVLCPVRRLASLVARIHRMLPVVSPNTTINTTRLIATVGNISSTDVRNHMRSSCTASGGMPTFGYSATDIGTELLRSGAAMGLFLMNHPVHKIMILGRWSSDAFLVYIRPQVLEWTNNMSSDMIKFNSFTDIATSQKSPPTDPRTRQPRFNADRALTFTTMQEMSLHH